MVKLTLEELLPEWDESNTVPLLSLKPGSHYVGTWKCNKGHKYKSPVQMRTLMGCGCPYCSGRLPIIGETDLKTTHPHLAEEWSPKNKESAENYKAGSGKKVKWICKNGHEWESNIQSRVRGNGCPYCSKRKALSGVNDLKTLYPEIAKEWMVDRNNFKIENTRPNSNKKAWFKCVKCGNEYERRIADRIKSKGCPICSGIKAGSQNNLAVKFPEVASEWDYSLNVGRPEDYLPSSHERVHWVCSRGHKWEAVISSRKACGCPYCNGKRKIDGETDLFTKYPFTKEIFDFEKNPEIPTAASNRSINWICQNGHSYKMRVVDVVKGTQCPECAGRQTKKKLILHKIDDFL